MSKVFVVNMNHHKDLTAAQQYGDIVFINNRYVYADEIVDGRQPESVTFNIRQAADGFNPTDDYLLIVGDHLQLLSFVAELSIRYTDFRVLRWDRKAEGYVPILIEPYSVPGTL